VGFHFDPLIYYHGWEEEYEQAVKDIFSRVDVSRVAWISLGAMRFTPNLRSIIRQRFPNSTIPCGEFVPGHHGKLRYFRPIREEMYSRMMTWIRRAAPQVFVYLCMESRAVWQCSFGYAPQDSAHLSNQMDVLVNSDFQV
jgi:spore photoproduct lyase